MRVEDKGSLCLVQKGNRQIVQTRPKNSVVRKKTGEKIMILNPKENTYEYLDEQSRSIMLKTIEFF